MSLHGELVTSASNLAFGELLVDLLVGQLLRKAAACKVFVWVVLAVPAQPSAVSGGHQTSVLMQRKADMLPAAGKRSC